MLFVCDQTGGFADDHRRLCTFVRAAPGGEIVHPELLRVLKPGGRLVIEEPDIDRPVVKLIALFETLTLIRSHFHTAPEINALIAGYGRTTSIERDDRFAV